MYEIQLQPQHIHLLIWMLRAGFELLAPDVHIVLQDTIFSVRENDEHDRQPVVRRRPQRLNAARR
jgi:hypothetical protein